MKQVETISTDSTTFFFFFFCRSDCSLKTNIMLRSSGTDFRLVDSSVVPKCLPGQHWNRIYSCFYFESLLISCKKGSVLMLLPHPPNFSGSFRACGGYWRSEQMQILLISHGDHGSAEFNVTAAFQYDLVF